jgi:hypothetical protein
MNDELFFISEGPDSTAHGPLLLIKGGGYMAFTTRELAVAFLAFVGYSHHSHAAAASELPLEVLPPVVHATVFRTPQEVDAMMADRTGYPYAAHMAEYHRPSPPPAAAPSN